jgi:hypothetical protein
MAPSSSSDSSLALALEIQTRLLLAELDKRFQAFDNKWDSRVWTLHSSDNDDSVAGPVNALADIELADTPIPGSCLISIDSDAPLNVNLTRGRPPSIDGHSASLTPFVHDVAAQFCYQEVEAHLTALDDGDRSDIRETDVRAPAPDDRMLVSLEGICQEGNQSEETAPVADMDLPAAHANASDGAMTSTVSTGTASFGTCSVRRGHVASESLASTLKLLDRMSNPGLYSCSNTSATTSTLALEHQTRAILVDAQAFDRLVHNLSCFSVIGPDEAESVYQILGILLQHDPANQKRFDQINGVDAPL